MAPATAAYARDRDRGRDQGGVGEGVPEGRDVEPSWKPMPHDFADQVWDRVHAARCSRGWNDWGRRGRASRDRHRLTGDHRRAVRPPSWCRGPAGHAPDVRRRRPGHRRLRRPQLPGRGKGAPAAGSLWRGHAGWPRPMATPRATPRCWPSRRDRDSGCSRNARSASQCPSASTSKTIGLAARGRVPAGLDGRGQRRCVTASS